MTSRRDFLKTGALAGGALALGAGAAGQALAGPPRASAAASLTPHGGRDGSGGVEHLPAASSSPPPPRRLRLLILGGTGFIGPWQVRYAVERGHEVTIFNRGQSAPGSLEGVEELTGDRAAGELDALRGRRWDAVIDNSASRADAPDWVRDSAGLLRDSADQYLFISTRSVFRDLSQVPATVEAPLLTRETTPNWEPGRPYPYGLAKALAEEETLRAFGERSTIVRPGLIVGPGDDTDRFTYWPVRVERGGEILAPGDSEGDRVQVIDVRDLCEWVVRLCEARTYGTFMAVGPEHGRSMAEFLYGIAAVTTAPLSWTWVPREFLAEQGFRPYAEMPVWRPPTPGFEGFARFDLSREVAAGLTFRSLADTAAATLEFHHSRPAERRAQLRAGASAEREAQVLQAWHARAG
jgi:2'-hydroxyisoflavone reductase